MVPYLREPIPRIVNECNKVISEFESVSRCTHLMLSLVRRRCSSLSTLMSSAVPPRTRAPRHRHHPRRHASAATAAAAPYAKPAPGSAAAPLPPPPADADAVSSTSTPAPPLASNFSAVRFSDFAQRGQISAHVLRGIPFEFCTHVQAATLDVVLQGTDVCVLSLSLSVAFVFGC
jgi:hypothetical protein